jgi:glucosamine 6-phosphate synthetase-like amidotransferase/phosphosugar isomerase protein
MIKRTWILSLLTIALISLSLFALKGFSKEQRTDSKGDMNIISEKIDEILKNQKDIITRLQDIRDQQDIIRIRASRK